MNKNLFFALGALLVVIAITSVSWTSPSEYTPSSTSTSQHLGLAHFAPDTTKTHFTLLNQNLEARFEPGQIALGLHSGKTITITFRGSDTACTPTGLTAAKARANYYRGATPKAWRENVPLYTEIVYRDLYPGIDLHYTVAEEKLKSEFIIQPGANPEAIQVHYAGIEELNLTEETLQIIVDETIIVDKVIPYAYEIHDDGQRPVTVRFHSFDLYTHGFSIEKPLNPRATLVIDPELHYATYFGGTQKDQAWAVATDYVGNTYLTGITWSQDLPVSDPTLPHYEDTQDVFIAKFDGRGALVYATYYGGSSSEEGNAIAADAASNAYVTGQTFSRNLPVRNAWQADFAGNEDAYVLKLDPQGQLEWATYIGGEGYEEANAIAVDQLGRVYIGGEVYSDDFPLLNPWRSVTYGEDEEDGFIAVFSPEGDLIYSTYVSGPERDQIFAITVDEERYVYAVGMTSSPDFPVHNAIQPTYGGGWEDCLILKLDPWNNELHFATFLGGTNREACWGVDFDQEGNIYIAGYTSSSNFPTVNAHQATKKGSEADTTDAFVARLNPSGTTLHYATYLGGSNTDRGWGIVADHRGYTYIAGQTDSLDFPTHNALQPSYGGGVRDGFITIFDPEGRLQYASYLSGTGHERLRGIALDGNWVVHIAGETSSEQMATAGAFQTQRAGNYDAYMARFAFIPTPTPTPTPTPYAFADIGPAGDALWISYPRHLTLLQVPTGTLNATTRFELVYDGRPDNQDTLQGINHFFALHIAEPQAVQGPMDLFLSYQETRGVIPETLAFYRLDAGTWVTHSITVTEQGAGHITAWIDQPGIYGILGRTNRLYLPLIMKH